MTSPQFNTFEDKLRAAAQMPQPRPEFLTTMRARLIEQQPQPITVADRLRWTFRHPAVAASLIVLLLVAGFLIVGPQRVIAAVRGLFGYIPDVGIVDTSAPIRVLSEPVSVTRDGITITVTSATLTGDSTHIDYRIFGVPGSAYPDREDVHGCWSQPYLKLADSTQLTQVNNGYQPVPASVNKAVFVIPCIANTLPGKVPENWELPLRFVPAPPDFTVVPVIELLPSQTSMVVVNTPTVLANTLAPEVNPLTITRVLDVGDKFVLMGEFNSRDALGESLPVGSWWAIERISITGADGREVPQTYSNDFTLPEPTRPDSETWLYQLEKNFVPPVTLTYTGQIISPIGPEEQAEFEFDAGLNPQNGSEWTVDKDFSLGGYNLRLVSIESSGSRGYSFHFKADPGASSHKISVEIAGYSPNCGGGGGGNDFPEEFDRSICYADMPGGPEFPHGNLKVVVRFQALERREKSFQVQWSPDPAQTGSFMTPTPQSGVCLGSDSLGELKPAPAAMAAGKALIYEKLDTGTWGLAVYSLDGSQKQVVVPNGNWGSLSPDGSQVAYSATDNGIHIVDLASQTEKVLPQGAAGFDLHWSPDGTQIAYVGMGNGAINSVFLVNTDGTQMRQISALSYESIIGWSPDGLLYYVAPYTGGAAWKVYAYDLASGTAQERFTIENGTPKFLNPKLSPDGNWIAYRGRDNSSLYLVRTDGSDMHLVLDNVGAVGIEWSRSGWLGVSLRKPNSDQSTVVLIRPDGCEKYLLPESLNGELEGLFIP